MNYKTLHAKFFDVGKLILVLVLFFLIKSSNAQSQDTLNSTLSLDLSLSIPSLDSFIDSALQYAPSVHLQNLEVEIKDRDLRSTRWEWLKYISLQGSYQYGNLTNYSMGWEEEVASSVTDNVSVSSSHRHSVGVSASIPLTSIFDRKNQNKIAKLKKDQAVQQVEVEKQSVRNLVIELYSQLLLGHEELLIANSNQHSTRLQVIMANKQFANGKMLLIDFANMKQLDLRASQDLINAKLNFSKTKALLEEVVGFKF